MTHHRESRRQKNRRTHHLRLVGSALIVIAALCAMLPLTLDWFASRHEVNIIVHRESDWDRWISSIPAMVSESKTWRSHPGRTVYPYSVVPGGVRDSRGLRDAVTRDPIVAGHYSGFKVESARVVKLRAAKTAYVSYRLRNKVYWTRNKVNLAPGEEVITDGEHLARARCGNRIAELPEGEISPAEPIAEVLDRPVDSLDLLTEPTPRPTEPETDPLQVPAYSVPDFSIPRELPVGTTDGYLPPGSGPRLNPPGTPPSSPVILFPPGPPNSPPTQPFDPPTPVPEPGTILVLSSGLSVVFALRRKFQK